MSTGGKRIQYPVSTTTGAVKYQIYTDIPLLLSDHLSDGSCG